MAVVATGFFDGVHLGHRMVIRTLVDAARERGEESIVLTFWPHPRTVLQDGARTLRLLTSMEEKKEMILSLGVDRVEVLDFSKQFSRIGAEEYLKTYVAGRYKASAVVLGYDNRVGGDMLEPSQIASLAASLGIDVISPREVTGGSGRKISSTSIRKAVSEGDVKGASELLGYSYSLHGAVVSGNRIGRTLGFKTANMQLYEPLKLLPANGVYLTSVRTMDADYFGMTNIGLRPTVSNGNTSVSIETHIFDFDEDIYGQPLRLHFLERIRNEEKFSSMEQLKARLEEDKALCMKLLHGCK